jgi:hypothetical protein
MSYEQLILDKQEYWEQEILGKQEYWDRDKSISDRC